MYGLCLVQVGHKEGFYGLYEIQDGQTCVRRAFMDFAYYIMNVCRTYMDFVGYRTTISRASMAFV